MFLLLHLARRGFRGRPESRGSIPWVEVVDRRFGAFAPVDWALLPWGEGNIPEKSGMPDEAQVEPRAVRVALGRALNATPSTESPPMEGDPSSLSHEGTSDGPFPPGSKLPGVDTDGESRRCACGSSGLPASVPITGPFGPPSPGVRGAAGGRRESRGHHRPTDWTPAPQPALRFLPLRGGGRGSLPRRTLSWLGLDLAGGTQGPGGGRPLPRSRRGGLSASVRVGLSRRVEGTGVSGPVNAPASSAGVVVAGRGVGAPSSLWRTP